MHSTRALSMYRKMARLPTKLQRIPASEQNVHACDYYVARVASVHAPHGSSSARVLTHVYAGFGCV